MIFNKRGKGRSPHTASRFTHNALALALALESATPPNFPPSNFPNTEQDGRPSLLNDNYTFDHLEAKSVRDPVVPAQSSEQAMQKVRVLDGGSMVHSFETLLENLTGIVSNKCQRIGADPDGPTFEMITPPDSKQQQCYELLNTIKCRQKTSSRK